jgi:hypothetical protein
MSGTRYWLAEPGGEPQGPFELAAITAMQREGRLTAHSQVCADGSTMWLPVHQVTGAAPQPLHPSAAPSLPGADGSGASRWEPASYVGPILVTIFCCLVGGIISLVYTGQANAKGAAGDIVGADRAKSSARLWLYISLLSSLGVGLLWLIVVAMGRLLGNMP